jgi:hypothetical protein
MEQTPSRFETAASGPPQREGGRGRRYTVGRLIMNACRLHSPTNFSFWL